MSEPYARRWWTLGVLCLSLVIVFVGNSSLNVALPTLSRDLAATTSQLQWVVASYSLVFAGLLFTAGALGDRFGRKGALQLGLVGFLIGVVLASFATQMWQLIACRALMGGCAAFIMPSTLSILVNVFPAGERAKAIAIWAGITGAAGPFGQVASGWLLGHFWFGAVFLVNVPIILTALVLGVFFVPRSRDPEEGQVDPMGAALSIVGISAIVFGLIQAPEQGWASTPTLGAFALGALVIVAFVLWERHHDEPMLDMAYFRNPTFSTATGGMILVFLAMFGVMFLMTQYFQLVLGFTPLEAAVRILPMAPLMMVGSLLTPRLIRRMGHNRTVACGMALISLGFLLFSRVEVDTGYGYILFSMLFLVTGMSLTMSPMTAAIMSAVPPRRAGAGSAMNDATRELGAALGVAVLGSIAASRYSSGIGALSSTLSSADQAAARTSIAEAIAAAGRLPAAIGDHVIAIAQQSFVDGIRLAALAGAVLAGIAALVVLRFLPRHIAQHEGELTPLEAYEETVDPELAGVMPTAYAGSDAAGS